MSMDDDGEDAVDGIGAPLPPEDRLWRHPSELPPSALSDPFLSVADGVRERAGSWSVAVVAGLLGAALCGGVLAVTGILSTERREHVVEKVALTPVVSSPGPSDDGGVRALAELVGPSVVRLEVHTEAGIHSASGVVFRDDGMLLASAHDLAGADAISVRLHDGREFDGELVGADPPTDVAVVSIDADRLEVAVLGSATDLAVGTLAIAVGSPSGDTDTPVATGVVSATQRRLDLGDQSLHGMIQTDVPIEPTWSGGPLVDATGAVIGITTHQPDGAGFGFATPIDLVRRMAEELVASGKVVHAWLGIAGADLTPQQAEAMGVSGGAVVLDVSRGSPAAVGGLAPDDVVTELGDHPVSSSSELVVAVRQHRPGDQVVVGYWRNGHHKQATVTIDKRP